MNAEKSAIPKNAAVIFCMFLLSFQKNSLGMIRSDHTQRSLRGGQCYGVGTGAGSSASSDVAPDCNAVLTALKLLLT